MREALTTAGFVAAAAVVGLLAWKTAPPAERAEAFGGQGERFFPDFQDSLRATSLEVIAFDEAQGAAKPFKVHLKDGRWTIPSHHDYPADAKDRMQKTAAAIIDLVKESIRSERAEDHEELGVIDPLDPKAGLKGRGTRVTLRDVHDAVLADVILGKPAGREGVRYARLPGQNRTYATRMTDEVSARFSDWIETDLLQLASVPIASVRIDSYSVDLDHGTLKDRQQIVATRDDQGKWKLDGLAETEDLQEDKLREMAQALTAVKIAGVRAKPEGLTEGLMQGNVPPTREAAVSLQRKGFYLTKDGLFSNEGELSVEMKDGVVYTLRFGAILVGEGEEVEAGGDEAAAATAQPADPPTGGKENRYLMVTARFEPSLLPEPKPEEPKADAKDDEKKRIQDENEKKKKEWTGQVEAGKKRAATLSERFAKWYYVIPAEAYGKVRLTRADLVKAKEPPKEPPKEGGK